MSRLVKKNVKTCVLLLQVYKIFIPLHRVFHSIRFKVNKDWDSAEPLFLCPLVKKNRRHGLFTIHDIGFLKVSLDIPMPSICPYSSDCDENRKFFCMFSYSLSLYHRDLKTVVSRKPYFCFKLLIYCFPVGNNIVAHRKDILSGA